MIPVLELPRSLRGLLRPVLGSDTQQGLAALDANLRIMAEVLDRGNQALLSWSRELQARVMTRLQTTDTKTARYVAKVGELVLCDPAEGSFDVVFPLAAPATMGQQIAVDSFGDNHVTVVPASGTVGRETSYLVSKAVVFQSDGRGNWIPSEAVSGWRDQQGNVASGGLNPIVTPTVEAYVNASGVATGWYYEHLRHDRDDEEHFGFQFDHSWSESSVVRPHVHFSPLANGAGNIVFDLYSAWAPIGQAIGTFATTATAIRSVTAADRCTHLVAGFSELAVPSSPTTSTMLLARIRRYGTSGADTYTTSKPVGTAQANVLLLGADVHYYSSRFGSRSEY